MTTKRPLPGEIAWTDLTIQDAETVRDFYRHVIGWKVQNVSMGEYNDYGMIPRGSSTMIAGVCHPKGTNADLPPVWLIYVVVKSLDKSVQTCGTMGGMVVSPPRQLGKGRMCVVRDPAGAILALYELPRTRAEAMKKVVRRRP